MITGPIESYTAKEINMYCTVVCDPQKAAKSTNECYTCEIIGLMPTQLNAEAIKPLKN